MGQFHMFVQQLNKKHQNCYMIIEEKSNTIPKFLESYANSDISIYKYKATSDITENDDTLLISVITGGLHFNRFKTLGQLINHIT